MEKFPLNEQICDLFTNIYATFELNAREFSRCDIDDYSREFYNYITDSSNNKQINMLVDSVIQQLGVDRENFKDLGIVSLFSNFYENNNMKVNLGFDLGNSRNVYEKIDENDYSMTEIIEMFKNLDYEEFGQFIIDDIMDYQSKNSIYIKKCVLLLKEQNKWQKMIKMNGMLTSSYLEILKNKYMPEEYLSDDIVEIYDNISGMYKSECMEDDYDDVDISLALDDNYYGDDMEESDKQNLMEAYSSIRNEIRDRLTERYGNLIKEVYGYMAGTVYSSVLLSNEKDDLILDDADLDFIKLMENKEATLDNIFNNIYNDDDMNNYIITKFIVSNKYATKDTFEGRKTFIEEKGYSKVLKKFVHCIDKEM